MQLPEAHAARTRRSYHGLLVGLLALGVFARILHFHVTVGADDQRWILAARQLTEAKSIVLAPVNYSRIVWRGALWLWGLPWGLTLESSAVLMFALSCIATVMVAKAAALGMGKSAALLAAAVYVTHPLNIIYDVETRPDCLGVAMLATSLYLFMKYLRDKGVAPLALAGLLVGLLYSVKEYFILVGPLFALSLLAAPNISRKARDLCLFCLCFMGGFLVDPLLHWIDSGSPLAHLAPQMDYGDRLVRAGLYGAYSGWRRAAWIFIDRGTYLYHLFAYYGAFSGLTALWGGIYLVLRSRRRPDYRLLAAAAALFLLFLMFMPAKISPFAFVEINERYLTVILPFLAIGTGRGLATLFWYLRRRGLKVWLMGILALGFAYNVLTPNDMLDRSKLLELVGIRQVLNSARERGISELVLPSAYAQLIPDTYYSNGVTLRFMAFDDKRSARDVVDYVEGQRGRAVFISRYFRWLINPLRTGEVEGQIGSDGGDIVKQTIEGAGLKRDVVRVPYTSIYSWLDWLGIKTKGQMVGWVYWKG